VKHVLLVGSMIVGFANAAAAQGADIHTRCGPSGSHFSLAADTQTFNYEATVSGSTEAYVVVLEVYHNGALRSTTTQVVLFPPQSYLFSASVDMSSWGLRAGDNVTFRLNVLGLTFGNLLATHSLIGDVVAPETPAPRTD